jgi:hypothetical protein
MTFAQVTDSLDLAGWSDGYIEVSYQVIIYFTANDYFGNPIPRWVDYYQKVKNPCIDPVYVHI